MKSVTRWVVAGGLWVMLACVQASVVQAEPPQTWAKSYAGIVLLEVEPTADGGYLMAGRNSLANSSVNSPLVVNSSKVFRTDAEGNILWEKALPHGQVGRVAIEQDLVGNIYLASGTTDFFPDRGRDVVLTKLTPAGDVIWSKTFYSADYVTDTDDIDSLTLTPDGGLLMNLQAGYSPYVQDNVIVRLDPDGNTVWQTELSWLQHDYPYNVLRATADGGCLMAGSSFSTASNTFLHLARLDAQGQLVWSKGYTPGGYYLGVNALSLAEDGGFVVSGSINGAIHPFLIKFDSEGNAVWQKVLDLALSTATGSTVVLSRDLSGGADGYLWATSGGTFRVGLDGTILEQKDYQLSNIVAGHDNGYVLFEAGNSNNTFNAVMGHSQVIKIDNSLNLGASAITFGNPVQAVDSALGLTFYNTINSSRAYNLASEDRTIQELVQPVRAYDLFVGELPSVALPSSLNFGTVALGEEVEQDVDVVNNGNAPLDIWGVNTYDWTLPRYSWVNNCPPTIYPGENCTFTINYHPPVVGSNSGYLDFLTSSSVYPYTRVQFSGSAIDDIDNDGYGYALDCNDHDPAIYPGATEVCTDGIDNDCDLTIDDLDVDCAPQPEICDNGIDDDWDGLTDCADTKDCRRDPVCADDGGTTEPEICTDGIDNDGDGKTDCDDKACRKAPECQ